MTHPGPYLWKIGGNYEKLQAQNIFLDFALMSVIAKSLNRGGTGQHPQKLQVREQMRVQNEKDNIPNLHG